MRPFLGLVLVGLAACGDGDAPDWPLLEIGTGQTVFQSFDDGAHMRLQADPQGNYFVWLSLRAELPAGPMAVTLDLLPTHPARPEHLELALVFRPVPEEAGLSEFVGYRARIRSPECTVGNPVEVRVQLVDRHGVPAQGSLRFVPDPPRPGLGTTCIE